MADTAGANAQDAGAVGRIFNIQHFSVHDGPGIRTVVFFKGCPLRCAWCANPESQVRSIQLGWTHGSCIGCKSCEKRLAHLGCRFEPVAEPASGNTADRAPVRLVWNKDALPDAAEIDRVCPSGALHAIGRDVSVADVLSEVEKDSAFYAESSGGMTLSGGEPLLQADFVLALLREAGKRRLHRAMETTGLCRSETFLRVAGELDYLLMDVKTWSPDLHEQWTGVTNEVILQNLVDVRRNYPALPILVRTPVVPGVNDSEGEIGEIARFVRMLGANTGYELLQYHKLGEPKYTSLGRNYELSGAELSNERFTELKQFAERIVHEG